MRYGQLPQAAAEAVPRGRAHSYCVTYMRMLACSKHRQQTAEPRTQRVHLPLLHQQRRLVRWRSIMDGRRRLRPLHEPRLQQLWHLLLGQGVVEAPAVAHGQRQPQRSHLLLQAGTAAEEPPRDDVIIGVGVILRGVVVV